MPIRYSFTHYTNPRIMTAEQKILDWAENNKCTQITMQGLMELTGENHHTVEKAIAQIRSYRGYRVECHKRKGVYQYQVIYEQKKDPWRFLFNAG